MPPGWIVDAFQVEWGGFQNDQQFCEDDCAYDGTQFLNLCADTQHGLGGISQTVARTGKNNTIAAGDRFVLSYALNAWPSCGRAEKLMNVFIDGMHNFTESKTRVIDPNGGPYWFGQGSGEKPFFGWKTFGKQWEMRHHIVTASGPEMTIAFRAIDEEDSCGCMAIDKVELVPIDKVNPATGYGALPHTMAEFAIGPDIIVSKAEAIAIAEATDDKVAGSEPIAAPDLGLDVAPPAPAPATRRAGAGDPVVDRSPVKLKHALGSPADPDLAELMRRVTEKGIPTAAQRLADHRAHGGPDGAPLAPPVGQ